MPKSASKEPQTITVLGGAGAMGRITVRDLVETSPEHLRIVIADYDEPSARKLAKGYRSRRVSWAKADASDVRSTSKLLGGCFAVISAVQHDFNLAVMRAALSAGAHYCDLGGLFHVTRKQLEMHAEFQKKGLLAILGMGAAPGIINVLARSAADRMDEVREIHCLVAGIDRTPDRPATPFGTSYSVQTILEEASLPAAIFTGGRFRFVEPMSGAEDVRFPSPVGLRRPCRTIHSEVATLPLSYSRKGIREVSFKIAFADDLDEKLRFLHSIGLLSPEPIDLGGARVAPRALLLRLLSKIPRPASSAVPNEYEVLRAIVRGRIGGKMVEEVVDCHVPGIPAWRIGVDADTGCPPSIAMQMLARGEIDATGALPPEVAIPAEPFFRELSKRNMRVRSRSVGPSGGRARDGRVGRSPSEDFGTERRRGATRG